MCIQFLDPLIPLTSLNQSIISRFNWKTVASSSRLSTVSIIVVMPPDSNNPTLTSSSPLSLDTPSKDVSSISQLTQWLWLAVLAISKWNWGASRKSWNSTTPHHAPPEPDVMSTLSTCRCSSFIHWSNLEMLWCLSPCTLLKSSFSAAHTVSNIWGSCLSPCLGSFC